MRRPPFHRWQTLPQMFFAQARVYGTKPFLWTRGDNGYESLSWQVVAERVRNLSAYLGRLNLQKGERVLLCASNSPSWFIADLAIMNRGALTVPLYTTYRAEDYRYFLEHTEAALAIVDDSLYERFVAAGMLDHVRDVLVIGTAPTGQKQWHDIITSAPEDSDDESTSNVQGDDASSIIYTSGSSANPKGVVLSHRALLSNCQGCWVLLSGILSRHKSERFLSFLPLSHAYERTAGQFLVVAIGGEIYYLDSLDNLAVRLAEVRPTLLAVVPRLLEAMRQRMLGRAKNLRGIPRFLWQQALTRGEQRQISGKRKGVWDYVLDTLVCRKVRAIFGGQLKILVSGGAALPEALGSFFNAFGVPLVQGYGQTESAPVISCNLPSSNRAGSVGRALSNVQVRLSGDNEILVRGALLMSGYWRNDAATVEALADGWLHTGDQGKIDADGYLFITGRLKEIIVTSGGDTLSPQRIEGLLSLEEEIAQAMVWGDGKPWLSAVLVAEESWAKNKSAEDIHTGLERAVKRVNTRLSLPEHVRRFVVAQEPFSIVNGMLTPTMKIKRRAITQGYEDSLLRLYRG
ncbi:MAG: long-chain fatty acid--CoA ligase [Alphaproteobacteria bacterium GM202ARS2]|nr:long-chain fatty acid--CoA ligase [Alphaproteobacteria bacterium GM202ARS2]